MPLSDREIDQVIDRVIAREGGYSNNPVDAGHATNFGITIEDLASWRNAPVTPADVRAMTEDEARAIYRHDYVFMPGFDAAPSIALGDLLIDCGVGHGVQVAAKWLQVALNQVVPVAPPLAVDGVIGPKTRAVLERIRVADQSGETERDVFYKLCAMRLRLDGRIVTAHPSQATFAAGWSERTARFVETGPFALNR